MNKVAITENAFSTIRITMYAKEFTKKDDETVICVYNTEESRDRAKKPNKDEKFQIYSHRDTWLYKIRNDEDVLEKEDIEFESFKEALLDLCTNVINQVLENVIFSEEIIQDAQENIPIDKNGNCLN